MQRLNSKLIEPSNMERERLFSEFPPVSAENWKEKIVEDLKGADYDKKMV